MVAGPNGACVYAKPPHKQTLARYYGPLLAKELQNCTTCHLTEDEIVALGDKLNPDESQPWNAFGRSLYELGKSPAENAAGPQQPVPLEERLRAVAEQAADGDGVPNELELAAGCQPGNPQDKPTAEELAAASEALKSFRRQQPDYAWRPYQSLYRQMSIQCRAQRSP